MPERDASKIPDDEIDILKILSRIRAGIAYPFKLWFNNKGTSLAFIALAVVTAIVIKFVVPPSYKSSFIIRPSDRTERFHLQLIGSLEKLRKQKNYAAIATMLGIKENEATTLDGIEYLHPAIKYSRDTINCTEIFIESSDYMMFNTLQAGIMRYLESNPYFKKIRDLNIEQIAMELKEINSDLEKLDSLKQLQLAGYRQIRTSTAVLPLNDLINPVAGYATSKLLIDRKTMLVAKSRFIDSFYLVSPCAEFKKPDFPPRIILMCLILIPAYLIICSVFLAIRDRRRNGS